MDVQQVQRAGKYGDVCQEKGCTLVGTNEDVKSNEKTISSFVFQDGFGIFQRFAKTSMLAGKYGLLHK